MKPRSRRLTFELDRPLVILIIVSLLIRAVFLLIYQPASFNDTLGYIDAGRMFQQLDFEDYSAIRTPVYPLLLSAAGFDPQSMWLVQSLMGLAVAIMLYLLARYHLEDGRIAFAIAIGYSLTVNLLFFEAALLTETTSSFLLLLSLLFFILSRRRKGRLFFYGATAAAASLAALTRPLMLPLAPLYLLFFILRWRRHQYDNDRWIRYLAAFSLPVLLLFGSVILFNGFASGTYTLSNLTGYNLVGHAGAFMEDAPEEYATIRDIYLKYRDIRIAETGRHIWTIWDAQTELRLATGLDFVELNDVLTRLSLRLIAAHPLLYLKNVAIAWVTFWASAVLWDLEMVSVPILRDILAVLWLATRWILILINFIFLVTCLYSLRERRRVSRLLDYDPEFHWLALSLVLVTSILQAFLIFADNWRFSVPYQPLIAYVVIAWLWLFGLRRERNKGIR